MKTTIHKIQNVGCDITLLEILVFFFGVITQTTESL